jgi:hypothetical protein
MWCPASCFQWKTPHSLPAIQSRAPRRSRASIAKSHSRSGALRWQSPGALEEKAIGARGLQFRPRRGPSFRFLARSLPRKPRAAPALPAQLSRGVPWWRKRNETARNSTCVPYRPISYRSGRGTPRPALRDGRQKGQRSQGSAALQPGLFSPPPSGRVTRRAPRERFLLGLGRMS